jgi:trans-aconitate methyltransferase
LRLYSVADFGCGPALTLFELARRFPKVNFSGFDFSSAVIQRNNDRVRDLVLHNLTFERSTLPNVPSELSFSLVLCIATLHYVKKSLLAIQNLLGTLKPGGFLIFNYPNRYSVYWYRRNADEEMKGRFALLLSGKNVLSKRVAEKALARSCDNFWTLMGENINRANPCVFVSKKA